MSHDYGRPTGQPRKVTLAGVEYQVPKLTPSILGELDTWLKEQVPNPRVAARDDLRAMADLPEEVQKHVWTTAVEEARDWPPRHDSVQGNTLLFHTYAGLSQFLFSLLKRTTPGITIEQAGAIVDSLSEDGKDVQALLEAVSPGEVGDPKAPATVNPASTP